MRAVILIRRIAHRAFVAACVLIAGVTTPLVASAGAVLLPMSGLSAPADHPDLDWAGSQIRIHEQAGPGPRGVQTPSANWLRGFDVSSHQPGVDFRRAAAGGARFAYVKATEGTSYINPSFAQQYNGAFDAGLIRGAYHFALPNRSSGKAQADYFIGHGGGWSRDGRTLPPMLDIEYNPYGATCYGLSASAMAGWVRDFATEVHTRTGRWPTIYTSTSWWHQCTGDRVDLATQDPLFVARYAGQPGPLPSRWTYWTFWQYSDSGSLPGDQDYFDGSQERLRALANG
ncbi:MAG TPA: lysozyme [Pseudonocardiaceae bacterium]